MHALVQSKMQRRKFLAGIGASALAAAINPAWASICEVPFMLGQTKVSLRITGSGGVVYFAPHQNETTAPSAALAVMKGSGGTLIQIIHTGPRDVSFIMDGRRYEFDPNRIYTDAGLVASLKNFGGISPQAHAAVSAFAQSVLAIIAKHRKCSTLTGVHNNGEGYSIESYEGNHPEAGNASSVHRNARADKGDFFFATHESLYSQLEARGCNAALQSPHAKDDGSMSVCCAQKNVPYVNIEARLGHFGPQVDMLKTLCSLVGYQNESGLCRPPRKSQPAACGIV